LFRLPHSAKPHPRILPQRGISLKVLLMQNFQTAASVLKHRLPHSAKPHSRILPQRGINMTEEIRESSLRLKLMAVLFTVFVAAVAVYTDIGFAHYKITGEPDLSYWTRNSSDNFESEYTGCMPLKLAALSVNGAINKSLGQREMNEVIRMNNGYLMSPMLPASDERLKYEADQIIALQNELESQGVQFLYVATLTKNSKYDPQLPVGEDDYTNSNLDKFLSYLDEGGVNYLDLRETAHEEGLNTYDLFYHTDHHWTTEAGFWAYTEIAKWLEANCGFEIDDTLTDFDNYEVTHYENAVLGSRGKRVGVCYGGLDDFDVIKPKFETKLEDLETHEVGTFEDLLINEDYVKENKDKLLSADIYDLGLQGSMHTQNQLCTNDSNIILVGDSFSFTVEQYLALSTNRFDVLSAYVPNGLADLVKQVHPTCVIVAQCPVFNLGSDMSFDFGYGTGE
jgi:hypothetical protein